MKKGLTQFMEEKQQEYDERVKYWVQLVKAGERIVRRKKTQCEKMNKKVKKRPSLTLVKHLQIERKTRREKKKLRMETSMKDIQSAERTKNSVFQLRNFTML